MREFDLARAVAARDDERERERRLTQGPVKRALLVIEPWLVGVLVVFAPVLEVVRLVHDWFG